MYFDVFMLFNLLIYVCIVNFSKSIENGKSLQHVQHVKQNPILSQTYK